MIAKQFVIAAQDIRPLATGKGACLASDRITVSGQRVGFMYREAPDNASDSGWRFFSGEESQDFADDPNNFEIYDVNTIANYDPDIIPLLEAPAFSAFERESESSAFVRTDFPG
ncbi:DUF2185 domain-containing protein [Bradyrhizobium huanghuaihaiense]|uniref:DUF2185 domain-containing protein n=1 Tax=Bradyrhizobium huanghuaihaiense TaxID=990078 RepID=UPI0021AA523E|nr:DUF2185 domain-containing protein [Bradyrhizobium sp. CB3035]UWU81210.1 DUF2185 domain-containing protein [Bradyrhizobium sp. CB3035]